MDAFAQFWPGLSGHSPSSHWLAVALAAAGVYAVGLCALFIVARRFDPLRRRMDALAGQARAPALRLGERRAGWAGEGVRPERVA